MTAHTPLEQALAAWGRVHDPQDRQPQVDDAVALGETGMFSSRQIEAITGLDKNFVAELIGKKDKTGGRFNPECLSLIYDVSIQWAQAKTADERTVRTIVAAGVSPGMLSRLAGIPRTCVYRRLA